MSSTMDRLIGRRKFSHAGRLSRTLVDIIYLIRRCMAGNRLRSQIFSLGAPHALVAQISLYPHVQTEHLSTSGLIAMMAAAITREIGGTDES